MDGNHPAPAPDQVPDPTKMVAPPAEGEVAELVDFLEQLGSDHDDLYPPQESMALYRAADLLKQQAAELAECREALRRVRLQERIPGGFW